MSRLDTATGSTELVLERDERAQSPAPVMSAPLSWGQKQMVRAMGIDRHPDHFHMTDELEIRGPLDVERLAGCLADTFFGHAMLHVRFGPCAGAEEGLEQRFDGRRRVVCPIHDLRALDAAAAAEALAALRGSVHREPFPIADGPLFRYALVRLSDLTCVLLLAVHHLVADDWSMRILQQDLAARFLELPTPPAEPRQETPAYFVFAREQHEWLSSAASDEARKYWSQRLGGLPGQLPLPFDRPRDAAGEQQRAAIRASVPADVVRMLRGQARTGRTTLFAVLLAAYDVLLWRLSHARRIPVATLVANRDDDRFDATVGLFFNTLVVVADIDPDCSFRAFAASAARESLDAMAHQSTPFQLLVDRHLPVRDPLRAPFTQALFAFLGAPGGALRLGEVELVQKGGLDAGSVYDLKMTAFEGPHGVDVVLEYNADLFDAATVAAWRDVYLHLLGQVAADFDLPLRRLGFEGLAGVAANTDLVDDWGCGVPAGFVGWQQGQGIAKHARRRADDSLQTLDRMVEPLGEGAQAVSLSEIERVIEEGEGIRRAVVTVDDEHGLVAHLVHDGDFLDLPTLRRRLYTALPMYAVPTEFRTVPWIPEYVAGVPVTGELWSIGRDAEASARRAPSNAHEAAALALWREAIRRPDLGPDDNFFASGGNSLSAAWIVAESRQRFGATLSVHDVFQTGTVARFAERVAASQGTVEGRPWHVEARGSSARWAHLEADGLVSYPASEAQARMWVLDRLVSGSDRYILKTSHRIRGPLDRAALRVALRALTDRHEQLRAVFREREGEVRQMFLPSGAIALMECPDGDAREGIIQAVLEEPFDLHEGPLVRVLLADTAAADVHEIHVALHHIVADGWSLNVLMDDWLRLYAGARSLPALPAEYRDYCCWRHTAPILDAIGADIDYWREQLRRAAAVTPFPEKARSGQAAPVSAHHAFRVDAQLCERLARICSAQGTSLHTIMLAGFALAIWRYTGQSDLSFGEPVANRDREGMDRLVGLFVNTLVLRLQFRPETPLRTLLDDARQTVLGALAHATAPFEEVVQALKASRHLDGSPLFDVMFSFNEFPPLIEVPTGLRLEDIPQASKQPKVKLACMLTMADGTGHGDLEFRADLLDEKIVAALAADYVALLEQWAQHPDAAVHELAVATARVTRPGAPAGFDPSAYDGVFSILGGQAALTPGRPALRDRVRTYTYADVMEATRRVAGHLHAHGFGAGSRIGICAERSSRAVLCAIAILRSGGAYSPMYLGGDMDNWREHVRVAGLDAVIVGDATTLLDGTPALVLDDLFADIVAAATDHRPHPQAPAVIFRTSGSTGHPKYVVVPQQGIVDLVAWARAAYSTEDYRNGSFATALGFDVSLFEMFVPWALGGCATLMENLLDLDAGDVPFSAFSSTPTQVRGVLDERLFPRGIRVLNMAGEALPSPLVERIFAETDVDRVVNLYGPTEATVYASFHVMRRGEQTPVSIGCPQPHVNLYVVDETLAETPVGVAGEICIGGSGLAHGYAGSPALTAEFFVPDPFSSRPGARLYRTRDIGCVTVEGSLNYLGRIDSVQKLRGVWVNFNELTADVRACTNVRDAVVTLAPVRDLGDERPVVAFCVMQEETVFDEAALRQEFRERVAPTRPLAYGRTINRFVQVEALPINANGKIDVRALHARLPCDGPAPSTKSQAPTGHMASVVWNIWRNVIKVEAIKDDDDFFAIGGHSLMALRMLSELKKATGVVMPLGAVFEFPVFAEFVAEATRLVDALAASGEAAQGQDTAHLQLSAIQPADRSEVLPVSSAQQRMWFMAQMDGGSEAYHIAFGLRLDGRVDRPALRRALDTIIARHESLRTTFHFQDGTLVQRIAPAEGSRFPLTEHDLRGVADWKSEVVRLSAATALEPFNFETGPLVRGTLLQVTEDRFVMRITMHHMVSDGWSMGVMRREFGALYTAFQEGKPNPLAELPIQHVDYVVWQRKWMESEAMRRQAEYWRNNLAGAPTILDLPTDRTRPTHPQYAGNVVQLGLDLSLSESIKALGRRHGATPYMTLLAGWAVLLARLAGQRDVLVGSPVANRIRAETEGLIGFFANNLVLRLKLDGSPTVADVIAQARRQALAAQRNQDIPFELVVELMQPARSLSHSPLFQVMFAWQNMPRGKESELSGLRTGRLRSRTPRVSSRFDLTLSLYDMKGRIVGGAEYSTALFDRETVTRYLRYYRNILAAMVADDRMPVDQLSMLDDDERQQLVETWNDTATDLPIAACLHHPFQAQVARVPDNVALRFGDLKLTYAELDRLANRVAHRLIDLGVASASRVAICAQRGFAPVIAMLGVLKAGGAYVPLDPTYPTERLSFILADCAPAAVLTDTAGHELVAAVDLDVPCLSIETAVDSATPAEDSAPPKERTTAPRDLAYVIYTSGSTGRPKGVMIEHRGALNTIHDINRRSQVGASDRVLGLSSVAFDLSVYDIFGLLAVGGTLVIPPREDKPDPANWLSIIADGRVTVWNTVPALMQLLVDATAGQGRHFDHVRVVMLSGDWVSRTLVAQVQALMPHAEVHSLGGATEGSIWSIAHPAADRRRAMLPYGRALANQHMYVLDSTGEPCPIGVTGELYIGGAGVARGYLRRPALTAQRFVPDHLSGLPGATLYRTGDLGRWLPEGIIEFQGRRDSQIKLRGFRIELGEIEARLREHPAVREAVVCARDDVGVGRCLVAYVVARDSANVPAPADLHAFAASMLPDYMLPTAYVPLASLPLSPNGKVARDQLPPPGAQGANGPDDHVPPRPGIETALAEIWSELLPGVRVGRTDNFFELGGHSLLVMRVVVKVRERLGIEMRMSDVFAHPVLAELAAVTAASSAATLPPVVPVEHGERIPLSFAQRRLWFLCQVPEISRAYHISLGLTLTGPLDRRALRWALDRIVARHDALRTTFGFEQGEPFQRIAPAADASFALSEHDLVGLSGWRDELGRLARQNAQSPFDLAEGPLVRGCLVRLGEDKHVLRLTVHHIVADAVSVGILAKDLSILYRAGIHHEADTLALPPVHYADFAHWQRQWVEGDVLQAQAAYWRKQLAGVPTLLQLPTDHARPPVQRFTGSLVDVELDAALTTRLKELAARNGVTLHMVLIAAWGLLLGRLSGQDDVVIGVPVSNRRQAEIENVIGFFLNTLALRIELGGNLRVDELLARVKAVSVDALQNQDIPFEQVVELLKPARSLAHSPVFQVMFQWQTRSESNFTLDGLDISRSRGTQTQRTVKFDMTLSLYETDERIVGGIEYASALFDAATIERYAGHFATLLREMAQDDARGVAQLPMLSPAEHERLFREWIPSCTGAEDPRCIHELFEASAHATPAAIAISCEGDRLTYEELDALAERVAGGLRREGVGVGDRVALCMDRDVRLVACLLGVLKAGAAYVPLDPAYPVERLRYMVSDVAPALLIADGQRQALIEADGAVPCRVLAPDRLLADQAHAPPRAASHPASLAYIIYTSGSTGRPKGVAIEHRQAVNFLLWAAGAFSRDELRGTLFATSLNFDLAVFECLLPLIVGAEVRMLRNVLDLEGGDTGTTLVNTVPSAMRALLDAGRVGPAVSVINLAGEVLPDDLVKRIFASTSAAAVCNLYGPSETTTYSTWMRIERGKPSSPTLGRPVGNTRLYILDPRGEPVPQGVVGEICIGGRGVTRGYWGRPGLSAERFVPDPFAMTPGARMYRTGDLGRWLADGTIAFLGRNDHQVKLRGFRIELGEIEACLAEDPGVSRVAVVAKTDGPEGGQLTAYLVPAADARDTASLRSRVAERLPAYMAPAHYVWLDRFPTTPTGKLDRSALPAPSPVLGTDSSSYAPEGEVEKVIASTYGELLGVQAVGRDDNFFALGGHSLLVMRLVAALGKHGWSIGPLDVFMSPTVRGLAERVIAPPTLDPGGVVHVRRTDTETPLFFVHDGTDNLQYIYLLEPHLPPSLPVVGLPAPPRDDRHLTTIEAMGERLVEMIVQACPTGPYRVAGWSIGGLLAYEVAHQLHNQSREVSFVGLFDTAYLRGTRSFGRFRATEADFVVDDKVYLLQLIQSHLALQNDYEQFSRAIAEVQSGMEGLTLEAFLERCRAAGILPPDFGMQTADQLRQTFERQRLYIHAQLAYRAPRLEMPVHLFQAEVHTSRTPLLGWGGVLEPEHIRVIDVPGDHFSMMSGKNAAVVGRGLAAALSFVRQPTK